MNARFGRIIEVTAKGVMFFVTVLICAISGSVFAQGVPSGKSGRGIEGISIFDLQLTVTATPSVFPGGTVTHTWSVRNNGPDDSGQFRFLFTESTNSGGQPRIISSSGAQVESCGGPPGITIVCDYVNLVSGATLTITSRTDVDANIQAGATIDQPAALVPNSGDSNPQNNTATATTTVQGNSSLAVSFSISPQQITLLPGESRQVTATCNFGGSGGFLSYYCQAPIEVGGTLRGTIGPCAANVDFSLQPGSAGLSPGISNPGTVSNTFTVTHCPGANPGTGMFGVTATGSDAALGQPSGPGSRSQNAPNFSFTLASATSTNPTLTYSPTPSSTIPYNTSGSASPIVVTPSGGAGAGQTTLGSCTITGDSSAFPNQPSGTLTFGSATTPQNRTLPSCAPQFSGPVTATLTCSETPAGGSATSRTWTLSCPQAPGVPPTTSFNPAPGSTVALTGTATGVGGSASALIRVSGTGAMGTGNATVACSASPAAFTVTPASVLLDSNNMMRDVTLACQRAATRVTGTATCNITRSDGQAVPDATFPLECPAATNTPPSASPVSITGVIGASASFSSALTVNDAEGGSISVVVASQPLGGSRGQLTVTPSTVTAGGQVTVIFTPTAGDDAIVGSGTLTLTDAAGGTATVAVNVDIGARTGSSSVGGNTPAAQQAIATSLTQATQTVADPVVQGAIAPTANLCANPAASSGTGGVAVLNSVCTGIANAADANSADPVSQALRALDSSERGATGAAALDAYRQRTSALIGRMTEIRNTGGRGFSLAGLTLIDGTSSIPVETLTGAASEIFGLSAAGQPEDDTLASESRWGFFLTGTYSRQDKDASTRNGLAQVGYRLDGYNISTGFDYRIKSSAVLGVAFNFSDSSTDFDGTDASSLDSRSRSLTFYGTWLGKTGGYLDAAVSFGKLDFDQDRLLDFTAIGLSRFRNGGSSEGNERAIALNFGKPLQQVGAFTFTPSIGFSYSKVDIDSFTETSLSGPDNLFLLHYDDTSVTSSLGNLSLRAERTWSWEAQNALVGWHSALTGYHEFSGSGASIVPTFPLLGDIPFGVIDLDETDSQYFLLESGLTYVSPSGVQLFFTVGSYLGIQDTTRYYFNLGGRYDF